ncbi:MAG: hypothetical protein ACRBFS_12030 [Aureispira sp.]
MKFSLFSALFLFSLYASGQTLPNLFQWEELKKDRTILMISSCQKHCPENLKEEIEALDSLTKLSCEKLFLPPQTILDDSFFQGLDRNAKEMLLYRNSYLKEATIYNFANWQIAGYLKGTYRDYEYTNYKVLPLILKEDEVSDEKLRHLALKYNVKFIVHIHSIEFSKNPEKKATLKAKLFDAVNKKFIFSKSFDGDSKNKGGFFMCQEGTVNCCINNASKKIFYTLLAAID